MYAKMISKDKIDISDSEIIEPGYKMVVNTLDVPEEDLSDIDTVNMIGYYEEDENYIYLKWRPISESDNEPSIQDSIDEIGAQALYTALMTNTLLTEE